MRWSIKFLESDIDATFTDGYPLIRFEREGLFQCWRLSTPTGFLDFIETRDRLYLNESFLSIADPALTSISFNLKLNSNGSFYASMTDKNVASGKLKPQPEINSEFFTTVKEMCKLNLVPYPKIPDEPGKSVEEIKALAKQYYPHRAENYLLALSIYDWTTASFARMSLFGEFCYTALEGRPLDSESLTDAIWTCNWPPYTHLDEYFMSSFLMKPAATREDVSEQLKIVAPNLYKYAQAETRVIACALECLPPTSVFLKPQLYSGQVDIGNLSLEQFAPGFFEFPLNESKETPLKQDLKKSLNEFIKQGGFITTKKIISFTDTIKDAMHYQNGILLVAEPESSDLVWGATRFVTPLSDGPSKIEYTFPAGSRFIIKNVEDKIIEEKSMVVITLQTRQGLDPDLVASNKAIPISKALPIDRLSKEDKSVISPHKTGLITHSCLFNKVSHTPLCDDTQSYEYSLSDDFVVIENPVEDEIESPSLKLFERPQKKPLSTASTSIEVTQNKKCIIM